MFRSAGIDLDKISGSVIDLLEFRSHLDFARYGRVTVSNIYAGLVWVASSDVTWLDSQSRHYSNQPSKCKKNELLFIEGLTVGLYIYEISMKITKNFQLKNKQSSRRAENKPNIF